MARYALTIFLSAFLLFQVQPLIAKYILPWFGGGPSVWTTCMLFFQTMLVGGYLYAHVLTDKVKPRRQGIVHLVVVLASLALLPISPGENFKPVGGDAPAAGILLLLLATVGGPYFILASTGPLMQRWFSHSYPGRSPYRLYSLSNVGSLLALLSYPVVVEPTLRLQTQVSTWSIMYVIFAALAVWCSVRLTKSEAGTVGELSPADEADSKDEALNVRPGVMRMLLWLSLSATGSAVMLATTNQMCIDVAAVPFLWVLPLALYLLTFVICFDNPEWYDRRVFGLLLVAATATLCWQMNEGLETTIPALVTVYSAGMFACCMTCHGELVRSRPHPRYLTLFYLLVSVGGTMGGLFVAIVAPAVFTGFWEYHIALFAACAITLIAWCVNRAWKDVGSAAFWTWVVSSATQILLVVFLVYRPKVDFFSDSDALLLFCGLGAIHVIGWVLTAYRERQPVALAVTWATVTTCQLVWVIGFVAMRLPGVVEVKQHASYSGYTATAAIAAFVVTFVGAKLLKQRVSQKVWNFVLMVGLQLLLWGAIAKLTMDGAITQNVCLTLVGAHLALCIIGLVFGHMRSKAECSVDEQPPDTSSRFRRIRTFFGNALKKTESSGVWFWAPMATGCVLLGFAMSELVYDDEYFLHTSRNFYGVLRVSTDEDDNGIYNSLSHGRIEHGNQYIDEELRREATTYYGAGTGVELAIRQHPRRHATNPDERSLRIGAVGLGAGTIAALGQTSDTVKFYEINAAVLKVAQEHFTYLSDSAATTEVTLGDARIMLEHELATDGSQQFDVLIIDAFSSDSIPVHLITKECCDLYRKHLKDDGLLLIHISNRYLDLEPITRALAEHLNWDAISIDSDGDDSVGVYTATWIIITDNKEFLAQEEVQEVTTGWEDNVAPLLWTDDFASLWQIMAE